MRYRNRVTSAVIDVSSKISGKNWEEIEEVKTSSNPPKKAGGNDGHIRNGRGRKRSVETSKT